MKRLYKGDQVSPLLHDVDAVKWVSGFGWSETPPKPTKVNSSGGTQVELPDALNLINDSEEYDQLVVLPTIGAVSAEKILAARPSAGFGSLDAVTQIEGLSSRIDWDQVKEWSKG